MVGSKAQARLFRENRTADLSKLEKWKSQNQASAKISCVSAAADG
jgi:hypothetical protein